MTRFALAAALTAILGSQAEAQLMYVAPYTPRGGVVVTGGNYYSPGGVYRSSYYSPAYSNSYYASPYTASPYTASPYTTNYYDSGFYVPSSAYTTSYYTPGGYYAPRYGYTYGGRGWRR